jgi:hypothetical protein
MAVVSKFPQPSAAPDGLDAVFLNLPDMRGATAVRAALNSASVIAVDAVFADIEELEHARPKTAADLDLDALAFLPERYADRYDIGFARRFVLVLADVTRRLATGWTRPQSVAEELALSMVFSYTQAVIDTDELDVAFDWREDLEQYMFEDMDFALLDEDDEILAAAIERIGAVNLRFEEWFTPFRAPYAAPFVHDFH